MQSNRECSECNSKEKLIYLTDKEKYLCVECYHDREVERKERYLKKVHGL